MEKCLTCEMRESEVKALRGERNQLLKKIFGLQRRIAQQDMEGMRHDELVQELTDRITRLEDELFPRRAVDLKTIKALGAGTGA